MGNQDKTPQDQTPRAVESDDTSNQSVLGEEDPGAALDTMSWAQGDNAPSETSLRRLEARGAFSG